MKTGRSDISELAPFDPETQLLCVIIETPRNSRNKFKFNDVHRVFELGSVLPAGSVFPYDFGFVPRTLADDGDPLDVLVLMDAPGFPGCCVRSRLVGVIEAEQSDNENRPVTIRNDRLVAVAADAHDYRDLKTLKDICPRLLKELEHFFVSYNEMRGKRFKLLGHRGPKQARKTLRAAIKKRKHARGKKT